MKTKNSHVISDPYLDFSRCVERLWEAYQKFGHIIVAFDYDNTVNDYYKKGYKYTKLIELIKRAKSLGCVLILVTCCDDTQIPGILKDLKENKGIVPDYVNRSPEYIKFCGDKVYYNILLDDRAGLSEAAKQLDVVLNKIDYVKQNNCKGAVGNIHV